jgi:hypothetical protein
VVSDRGSGKYQHIPVFTDESPLNQRGRFGTNAGTDVGVPEGRKASDVSTVNTTADTPAKRQYLKSAAELREEAEEEFRNKYPFKPQIIHDTKWLPVAKSAESGGGSKQDYLMQKIEGFRVAHEAKQRRREQEKRELEAMELQECTFRPQLSKGSEAIVRKQQVRSRSLSPQASNSAADQQQLSLRSAISRNSNYSATSRPTDATRMSTDDSVISHRSLPPGSGAMAAAERLHSDAHQRQVDMVTRAHFLRQAQQQEVTFKPQINDSTEKILRKSDYRPIFDRLGDEQRARSANREKLLLQHVSVVIYLYAYVSSLRCILLAD